jgi:PKD repeat protein
MVTDMKKLLVPFLIICISLKSLAQDKPLCGADELRISTLKANPAIAQAVIRNEEILETFTQQFVNNYQSERVSAPSYIIPVVFHVIHNYGTENISDAQIHDGLTILNKTFRKQLADTGSIVAAFKPIHADCEIEFRLATKDPAGNCTPGINRIASPLTTIGDHSVKSLIQWPPDKYLNVYIVANAAGLAGHCVWPADADTIPQWDGIVISHNYVGSIGTSSYTQSVAFAHECGHYLNLHHIWGGNNVPGFYYLPVGQPSNCGSSDLVADTPPTIGWQTCNLSAASCGNPVDNVQNTMDYSYCNRMFTQGQKARMQACLNSSIAGRDNLWSAANLAATGTDVPAPFCDAAFSSNKKVVCQSSANTITFSNTSYHGPFVTTSWSFPGGSPSSSMSAEPTITYSTPGKYDVTLTVTDSTSTKTITATDYVTVLPSAGSAPPFSESFESTTDLDGLTWFSTTYDTINEWEITSDAAATGLRSVRLNNQDSITGNKDELYGPALNLAGASPTSISFKYAYARKNISDDDKLILHISNNCNTSWLQRLVVEDAVLETAAPQAGNFIPAPTEWKSASVTIPGSYLTAGFRFRFTFMGYGGNNIYLDDINVDLTSAVSDILSYDQVLVSPNPANDLISISFESLQALPLRITLTDMLGRTIAAENFSASAGENKTDLPVDHVSPGIYQLHLTGADILISKKIVVTR